MRNPAAIWIDTLHRVTMKTVVTDEQNQLTLDQGVSKLRRMMRSQTTYLIGNGGSLAAAAHMATDFNLAGLRSFALVDPIALTSHANDFGVASIFTKQLETVPIRMGDVLLAMSCSGKSENILDAVRYGAALGMNTVTLTGFKPDNPLRHIGLLNFYVPAEQYGFVQLAHEAILHSACDIEAWNVNAEVE